MKLIGQITFFRSGDGQQNAKPAEEAAGQKRDSNGSWAILRLKTEDGKLHTVKAYDSHAAALCNKLHEMTPEGQNIEKMGFVLDLVGQLRTGKQIVKNGNPLTYGDGSPVLEKYIRVDRFNLLTGPGVELFIKNTEAFETKKAIQDLRTKFEQRCAEIDADASLADDVRTKLKEEAQRTRDQEILARYEKLMSVLTYEPQADEFDDAPETVLANDTSAPAADSPAPASEAKAAEMAPVDPAPEAAKAPSAKTEVTPKVEAAPEKAPSAPVEDGKPEALDAAEKPKADTKPAPKPAPLPERSPEEVAAKSLGVNPTRPTPAAGIGGGFTRKAPLGAPAPLGAKAAPTPSPAKTPAPQSNVPDPLDDVPDAPSVMEKTSAPSSPARPAAPPPGAPRPLGAPLRPGLPSRPGISGLPPRPAPSR